LRSHEGNISGGVSLPIGEMRFMIQMGLKKDLHSAHLCIPNVDGDGISEEENQYCVHPDVPRR